MTKSHLRLGNCHVKGAGNLLKVTQLEEERKEEMALGHFDFCPRAEETDLATAEFDLHGPLLHLMFWPHWISL
jgi:hypothetical protein